MKHKLKTWDEITKIVKELKSQNRKIIFTNGCFDILHSGHVKYLAEAEELGDILILGLNSDSSVKRLKGNDRPINNEIERATVLSALSTVSYIVIFEDDTPYMLINHIKPNILVKGGDWKPEEIVGSDIVSSYNGEVKSLSFIEGKSTTDIINKMKEK
ncbi:MAG: D-glycero-beta-D-manno-heptose 1-phosphate adenylyltransferase [Candidatus Cloacimonetes bacterium]|jgi:rfaE bifunctional protein nucleotidyltransferase chain/domain|nr:D-glycero-beta-D-manno-heptose 1-phosphate adenylyltransferase [Candidatus Cloacimonadota bacterium]